MDPPGAARGRSPVAARADDHVHTTLEQVEALAGADHMARLRAMDAVEPSSAACLVDALLSDGRPNALASAARLVARLSLTSHVDRIASLGRRGAPVRVLKAAVVCLGQVGRREHVPVVLGLVDHSNDMLRRAAVEALGRLRGDPSALVAALADPSWQVRMYAAIGLGGAGTAVDVRALVAAVGKEVHAGTAEQMARAVADLGGAEAVDALSEWVLDLDKPAQLRRAAARGLGELDAGGDVLPAAMNDPDAGVVEQVAWALRRAAGERGGGP